MREVAGNITLVECRRLHARIQPGFCRRYREQHPEQCKGCPQAADMDRLADALPAIPAARRKGRPPKPKEHLMGNIMPIICRECGREMPLASRGLCGRCYPRLKKAGTLDAKYPAGIGAIYLHNLDEFLAGYEADLRSFYARSTVDPSVEYPAPGRAAEEPHPVDLSEILDPPDDEPDDNSLSQSTAPPEKPEPETALFVLPQHRWIEQRIGDLARAILVRLGSEAPVGDQLALQHRSDDIGDWCEELADLVPMYEESLLRDAGVKLPQYGGHNEAGA